MKITTRRQSKHVGFKSKNQKKILHFQIDTQYTNRQIRPNLNRKIHQIRKFKFSIWKSPKLPFLWEFLNPNRKIQKFTHLLVWPYFQTYLQNSNNKNMSQFKNSNHKIHPDSKTQKMNRKNWKSHMLTAKEIWNHRVSVVKRFEIALCLRERDFQLPIVYAKDMSNRQVTVQKI